MLVEEGLRQATRPRCAGARARARPRRRHRRPGPDADRPGRAPTRPSPCSAGFPRPRDPALAAEARLEAGACRPNRPPKTTSRPGSTSCSTGSGRRRPPGRSSSTCSRPWVPTTRVPPATARPWPPACSDRRRAAVATPAPTGIAFRLRCAATSLALGDRTLDVTDRALVMGILNRTPDSFYDKGATFALDDLLRRAEELVADGADILDVGGVKAGPGPDGDRGRGARPGRPGHRRPARPLRRPAVGRHLAGVGGPRRPTRRAR